MNNIQKRFLLFLLCCIGVRTLLVVVAKHISINILPYMGYLALIPAIGFIYIYMNNLRKTGAEVMGDKIWWNNLRPIHALLYGLFAISAIQANRNAWVWLLIDVCVGLISFLYFHYTAGNFSKLLE